MDLFQTITEALLPVLKPVFASLLPVVNQLADLLMQLLH